MTELNVALLILILGGVIFLVYLNLIQQKIRREDAYDFDLKLQNLHEYNDLELDIDEELLNNNLLIPLVNNVPVANVPLNNVNNVANVPLNNVNNVANVPLNNVNNVANVPLNNVNNVAAPINNNIVVPSNNNVDLALVSNNELNNIINHELNQALQNANNAGLDLEELNSNTFINNSNTDTMLNNN
jgi:hypothetical protein